MSVKSPADLAVKDTGDTLPPVIMRSLRYHTIDGVEHDEGEEYEITTNAGIASTLIACQFADFAGVPPPPVGPKTAAAPAHAAPAKSRKG